MSQLTPEQIASIMDAYKVTSTEDIHHAVKDIMKGVLQQTLEAELDVSLGYGKYDRSQKDTDNSRNGSYKKQVKSSFGPIDLAIPRDRQGDHEPIIVKKGQSDVSNLQERVISMYGKGMSNRDCCSPFTQFCIWTPSILMSETMENGSVKTKVQNTGYPF